MPSCARRYVCALTSCMLQASYLLLVEKSGAEKGIGSTELLYYNSLLSLPFILMVGPLSKKALARRASPAMRLHEAEVLCSMDLGCMHGYNI